MGEKRVERRIREWNTKAGRAILYGPGARLADLWSAGRDAKKGVPSVDHLRDGGASGASVGTQRMMFLGQLGIGLVEKEFIRYQAEVADRQTRLRSAQAQRASLTSELAAAEGRLKQAVETDVDPTYRKAGEKDTAEAVIRDRRTRELNAKREREMATVRALTDRAVVIDAEIADLAESVRIRLEVAQTRAAMIEAHVRRRCAAYLARLVRKHADGKEINDALRPYWPELPRWTHGTRQPTLEHRPGLNYFGGLVSASTEREQDGEN